ncbi:MAG: tRNA (guanosine(37)-N1)-methyltransferase TrmD [Eubacteriaceae bacterium]
MKYYFLTLFPEIFKTYFESGMMAKGINQEIVSYEVINIRDFAENKHKKVDDYPFGGGPGMVMTPQPIISALNTIPNFSSFPVVYLTPGGKTFEQNDAVTLSKEKEIIFICGHYEGIDQRVIDHYVTKEYSVGDYVLTGGELPALTIADAVARQIPEFLGNAESLKEESFETYLLEYPQYTRPQVFEGIKVPEILLSGDHKKIELWRLKMSEEKTKKNRLDLFQKYLKAKENK